MNAIPISDAPLPTVQDDRVAVWCQSVVIPTYPVGAATPHPLYISTRVYQGSSGRVYPLPVTESVGDVAFDRAYNAVFLENRYVKVMVLPEIGGRIHMAYDKIRDYHFVYFNRVIKPALVGLAGPWISGGIEFNWPQHHRPSTFDPVEYRIDDQGRDTASVVLGEIDRMYGLRVTTRVSLSIDDARIHIESEVSNRTQLPQTFLWWANPAVSANESYQAIFPPDVRAVFDHGKRDVSRFPLATGTYYKVDYSHGVDISFYRTIPVPTSYMAHYSRHDFVGGYDHARRAGLLHVAANRYSPGKKLWTWGTSHFGTMWEHNLTDEDGPYIELMTGIYTDNQPDFTWIEPGETKQFEQWFFPYANMSTVRAANERAAISIEEKNGKRFLVMYAPRPVTVLPLVTCAGVEHPLEEVALSPEHTRYVALPDSPGPPCAVTLRDSAGTTILEYNPNDDADVELPNSAENPPAPVDVPTVEQLYLIGVHLEQNRHATWDPDDYFLQALCRDQNHAQSNIAMARRSIYRNLADDAQRYAQRAVERLCRWNTNPESGFAHYYLGIAESMKNNHAAARRAFAKASWSADARHVALYELAAGHVVDGDPIQAIHLLNECLSERPRFERALALRHIAYRKAKNEAAAAESRAAALAHNPLAYIAAVEEHFFRDDSRNWKHVWQTVLGEQTNRFIDVLCEYAHIGGGDEIAALCREYATLPPQQLSPLPFFIAAHAASDPAETATWRRKAESVPWVGTFPVRLETLRSLESAAVDGPGSALAHFLLGTAEYDRRNHHRAYTHWSAAAETILDNPTLYRNIALYQFNQGDSPQEALDALERAVGLAPTDGRLLLEQDELRKRLRSTPDQRRMELAKRPEVIDTRDDLVVRYAEMLTSTGRPQEAIQRFSTRQFHPWEGGEGVVTGAYRRALIQSALHSLASGEPQEAIALLTRATEYPPNLGEGRLPNTADNEISFWMGVIHSHAGNGPAAERAFRAGTEGESTPALSMYYNDVPARAILYQGLSWRRSGNEKHARRCFYRLRDHADRHEHDVVAPDYFAVSLPDLVAFDYDLSERNRLFCRTIRGLSLIGLGALGDARIHLESVLRDDPNNQDAIDHMHVLTTALLAEAVSWS